MATFPSLPGCYVEARTSVSKTNVSRTEDTSELRSKQCGERIRFSLSFRFLREPESEHQTLLAFFEARNGRYEAFDFVDPVDGTTRSVRFVSDEAPFVRVQDGLWRIDVELIEDAITRTETGLRSDVFPVLPGLAPDVTKVRVIRSRVQTAPSGRQKVIRRAGAKWRYVLHYKFLKGTALGATEIETLVAFIRNHAGRFTTFVFADPVTGSNVNVRFDDEEPSFERILQSLWTIGQLTLVEV